MRQAGRVHWITLFGGAGLIALAALFLMRSDTPSGVAGRFMTALAEGDVDTLVDSSYFEGSVEELRKQWEFTTQVAGRHFRFLWRITGEKQGSENGAAVILMVRKGLGPDSYEEKVDLPLVKDDGRWKVDVRGLYRGLYPALPR